MIPSIIGLLNWFQFDIEIKGSPKTIMQGIIFLVDALKSQKLIEKWFYLYEYTTIRLRFKTHDSKQLEQAVKKITT